MSINVLSSQNSTPPWRPKVVAVLYRYAVVIATAMSVIMPGVRSAISRQAPWRNTHPPYTKTATPKTTGIHRAPGTAGGVNPSARGIISPHTSVGSVSTSVIQNLFRNIATE